jgi:hypothetical protein
VCRKEGIDLTDYAKAYTDRYAGEHDRVQAAYRSVGGSEQALVAALSASSTTTDALKKGLLRAASLTQGESMVDGCRAILAKKREGPGQDELSRSVSLCVGHCGRSLGEQENARKSGRFLCDYQLPLSGDASDDAPGGDAAADGDTGGGDGSSGGGPDDGAPGDARQPHDATAPSTVPARQAPPRPVLPR